MTITPQEARSRQTAMEAERWFWSSRLRALVDRWRKEAETEQRVSFAADELERLIAERAK
jgi:hypothetical protein